VLETLVRNQEDPMSLRRQAAYALRQDGSERGELRLVDLLQDHGDNDLGAVLALAIVEQGGLRSPGAQERLAALANSPASERVLWCLARNANRRPADIEAMLDALAHGDARSACTAASTLRPGERQGAVRHFASLAMPADRLGYALAFCAALGVPAFCQPDAQQTAQAASGHVPGMVLIDGAAFAVQKGWVAQGLASPEVRIYSLAQQLWAQHRGAAAIEPLLAQWRSEPDSERRAAQLLALAAANAPAAIWMALGSDLAQWAPLESAAWVHAVAALALRGTELDRGMQWARRHHPWFGMRQAASQHFHTDG